MSELTEAQKKAVYSDSDKILVSAGAGSGKTFAMTERIIRLISEKKTTADRLLVVTFTNAAAAQMKKKIRDALIQRAALDESGYLESQIPLLEDSQISTVHSLCRSVIVRYYQTAGVDPSFGILSEDAASVLLSEAADQALEEGYLNDGDGSLSDFIDAYSGRDEEDIKKTVIRFVSFLTERVDPQGWLSEALGSIRKGAEEGYDGTLAGETYRKIVIKNVSGAKRYYEEALSLALTIPADHKRRELLSEYAGEMDLILKTAEEGSVEELAAAVADVKFRRYDIRKEAPDGLDDKIKALRNTGDDIFKKRVQKALSFDMAFYKGLSGKVLRHACALADLAERTLAIYESRKNEQRRLDYSDLERLCLKVLEDPDAAAGIRSLYDYVFVDEYQDTNDVQEKIIGLIAESGTGNDPKLFTVGDVKQSIYSFRNAEPELFTNRRERYEKKHEGELIQLSDNFRSDRKVIEFINTLFGNVMTASEGGIDYRDQNEDMLPRNDLLLGETPSVTAIVTSASDKESDDYDGKIEEEAGRTAALVSKLLSEGLETEEKGGGKRPLRPSDIAILLRNGKKNIPVFAAALRKAGIGVRTEAENEFYDMAEIRLAIDMLKVTSNLRSDIPLASVMRSFIYNFDPDDLVRIRLRGIENGTQVFHESVLGYDLDDATGKKIRHMLSQIEYFADMERCLPVKGLLSLIYSKTGLYAMAGTLPDGKVRQENLRLLRSMADSFESGDVKGLGAFIRYADGARASGQFRAKNSSSTDESGVVVTTVHRSKGLEYTVVIVACCGDRYNDRPSRSAILTDRHAGICMCMNDTSEGTRTETFEHRVAKLAYDEDLRSEEMRIFYVAATRAISRLYLIGTIAAERSAGNLNTVKKTLREGGILSGSFLSLLYRGMDHRTFEEVSPGSEEPLVVTPQEAGEAGSMADPVIVGRLRDRMKYAYPHEIEGRIPTKLSVSALKKGPEELELGKRVLGLAPAPDFARESRRDAASIGTLTHLIIEKTDTALALSSPEEAVERTKEELLLSGAASREDLEAVDTASVTGFFSSDIGRKMCSADRIYREQEFIMRLKASEISTEWEGAESYVMVQGIIDCAFEKDGKTYLLDYKSDRNLTEEKLERIGREYTRQVRTYMRAWNMLRGRPVDEAYICYLSNGTFVRVEEE